MALRTLEAAEERYLTYHQWRKRKVRECQYWTHASHPFNVTQDVAVRIQKEKGRKLRERPEHDRPGEDPSSKTDV